MEENIAMFSIKAKNEDGSGSKDAKPSSATKEEGFKKARTDTSSQKMTDEEVLSARDLEEAGVVLKDTDWYAGVTRHSNVTVLARIAKHRPIKIIQNICYHKIEEIEFVEVTHGKQAQNHSERTKEWRNELSAYKTIWEANGMFCTSGLAILSLQQNVHRQNKVSHFLRSLKVHLALLTILPLSKDVVERPLVSTMPGMHREARSRAFETESWT